MDNKANRVVARFADGRMVKGYTYDFNPGRRSFHALFAKETLSRINPNYKAKIVILLIRPYGANHCFCSFQNAVNEPIGVFSLRGSFTS